LASNEVKILGHRQRVGQLPMKSGDELICAHARVNLATIAAIGGLLLEPIGQPKVYKVVFDKRWARRLANIGGRQKIIFFEEKKHLVINLFL